MTEPTTTTAKRTDVAEQLRKLAQARQSAPSGCTHPPQRIYAWWAYDGTLCAACCDCGAVLAGAADADEAQP